MSQAESIRKHPQLSDLFIAAESRHLNSDEFERYIKAVPQYAYRVAAAREIKAIEGKVVTTTISEVFQMYPFMQNHDLAQGKCYRDVNYVSAYVTLAMLMNDPEWLRDKLLIWLKTILQAYCFPERNKLENPIHTHRLVTAEADALPKTRSSIFETYARLKHHYREGLSAESFALIEGLLQMCSDILASE
jgi:hypothetical protein